MKKQTVGKAQMAYLEAGSGHPIVFGHSFLWDAHMWDPQISAFQGDFRCIAPDLWSHGESSPLPDTTYSIEALAEDYWQFTQSLGLKKFALAGLSVGGMWAVQMALLYPEHISALVLMDTFVGDEPQTTQEIYLSMMDELNHDTQFKLDFINKVVPYFFAKNTFKEKPKLVNDFIQNLINTPIEHIAGKVALGRAIFTRHSLLEQLKNIQIPTLIVVGEEDLPRPPSEAKEMAKRIPNAEISIVPKAGHICTLEQPEFVNDVLWRFLKKQV